MKIFQVSEDVFNLGPFSQDTALLTTFFFGLEGRGCVSGFHLAFPIMIAFTSQIREQIRVSSSCQIYQIQLCTQGLSKWPWWVCGHIRPTVRQVGPGIHLSFSFHLTPPLPAPVKGAMKVLWFPWYQFHSSAESRSPRRIWLFPLTVGLGTLKMVAGPFEKKFQETIPFFLNKYF